MSADPFADLTQREALFVRSYAEHGRASDAWLEAGYKTTKEAASVTACKKLGDPRIRAALQNLQDSAVAEFQLDRNEIMRETRRLAMFDIRKLFDPETGKLKEIKDLDDDTAAAIAGLDHEDIKLGRGGDSVVIGQTVKVKLASKVAALDMAHKILGSYKADNDQKSANEQVVADFVAGIQAANKGIPLAKKRKR